jgi:hypothetical protein
MRVLTLLYPYGQAEWEVHFLTVEKTVVVILHTYELLVTHTYFTPIISSVQKSCVVVSVHTYFPAPITSGL